MGLLRLAALLAVIAIAASTLLYFATGQRRYLSLAKRLLKFSLIAVLLLFLVLFADRLHPFL